MTDKNQEIELKFQCDIEGIKKLRRAQSVKDVAKGNWRSRLLRAIYHDTADQALKRAGIALRTRKGRSLLGADPQVQCQHACRPIPG
jgi:Uncharacterized conserved protein